MNNKVSNKDLDEKYVNFLLMGMLIVVIIVYSYFAFTNPKLLLKIFPL